MLYYTPTVIANNPLPALDGGFVSQPASSPSNPSLGESVQPHTISLSPISQPIIANDVIGQNLDTQMQQIKNPFGIAVTGELVSQAGASILDQQGIVSTPNFPKNSVFDNTTRTTNSTSYVDLPGSTLPQFTLTRPARFSVSLDAYGANNALGADGSVIGVQLVDNGSLVFNFVVTGVYTPAGIVASYAGTTKIVVFDTGAHNLKLQFKVIGSGVAEIDSYDLSYVQLGT